MTYALFWFLCCVLQLFTFSDAEPGWFTYPIHDLNAETVQTCIRESAESLKQQNLFSIPHFLTPQALQLFQTELVSLTHKVSWSSHYKTVYQDKGDSTFEVHHPRNHQFLTQKGYLGRTDLSPIFNDLYNYAPLLDFLKQIVISGANYSNLHLSLDKEGSIYGQIYRQNSVNGFHFDQHPFSCVWILQKPSHQSGEFRYLAMKDNNISNWTVLKAIFDGDMEEDILSYGADQGEITCFLGNVTLHGVDEIKGDRLRIALVTAYSEFPNFQHSHNVNEINTWGEHKQDL